jgi:3-oxoadipate enol-lactonase/3-oxoadipate enol-lactonase/4-carboxymuconolactone decarboxylase
MPDPVLLLHGQPGNAHDWDRVRSAIGARTKTIALDRPGWDGRSAPLDLAGNARFALSLLNREGIERAVLVGHSLGGAIAAWLAAEHPERVRALVLAAPSASCASLNRLDELLAAPILGAALTTSLFAGAAATLSVAPARRRLARRLGLEDAFLRRYARRLRNPLIWRAFVVEQRRLVRQLPDLETRLPGIGVPTTIVIGTADRIVTPASARLLSSQIPGADLVQLDLATHLVVLERAAELAELIVAAASGHAPHDLHSEPAQDSLGSG